MLMGLADTVELHFLLRENLKMQKLCTSCFKLDNQDIHIGKRRDLL